MSAAVGVVGGGGFGQALARATARGGRPVVLWSRSRREPMLGGIEVTQDMANLRDTELVFVCVPSLHVQGVATELGRHLDGRHLLVHVSRGLVGEELLPVSRVLSTLTPSRRVGALAGPLVARGLAVGETGGGLVGSRFREVIDAVREAIGGPAMHVAGTDDLIGVEMASALVGLVVLAIGMGQGLGFGPSSLALLATRGVDDAARLGGLCGARPETFRGLAGFGDLIAAVVDDGRPELAFGRALLKVDLREALRQAGGAHVEGASLARRAARFAERRRVEVPLLRALADILEGRLTPADALPRLLDAAR